MTSVASRHVEDWVDMMLVRMLLGVTGLGVESRWDGSIASGIASVRRSALMQALMQRWKLVIRVVACRRRYRPTVRVGMEAWDTASVMQRRS